jgi:hypothetical protein
VDVEKDLTNSYLGMHGTFKTGALLGIGEAMLDFVAEPGREYVASAAR